MTKKILIIGSNGYLGSRLIEFLIFRTDYSITTVSHYYYDFNLFKSSRLISFQCDQKFFPVECIKNFDIIISLAPKYEKLVSFIKPSQTFIFTDPRYLNLISNRINSGNNESIFSYYHLELVNINGFSTVFDLSKSINYNVYLYKNNNSSTLSRESNENILGIYDFCRCIESLIIFGRMSRSGSYKLCSNLPNSLPFNFTYQDTYNTIVTEILDNWTSIRELKNPTLCLICKHPSNKIHWNCEFVFCTYCFHVQRKYILLEENSNNEKLDIQENNQEVDILNFDMNEILSQFLTRYSLCRENLVNSHNILIATPKILEKHWQVILDKILKTLSENSNLSIIYTTFNSIDNIHSLFDFIFLPDGIQTLDNPFKIFRLLSNKLFDNGKIILKTSSSIPFLSHVDLSTYITSKAISFYNTYSLKVLIERFNLYLNKCSYTEVGENILCMISKKNECISSCVNECFIYEVENNVYDQYSY